MTYKRRDIQEYKEAVLFVLDLHGDTTWTFGELRNMLKNDVGIEDVKVGILCFALDEMVDDGQIYSFTENVSNWAVRRYASF